MPGPNVHLASVEQSSFLIKKITNIPIIIGNSADVCEPNILHDHVTWNAKTWEGSLFDRIQAHFERIKIYRKDRRTVDNFF